MMKVQKYPAYKDSGVEWLGEIPEHWEVKPGFTIIEERNEKNLGLKEKVVLSLSYGKVKVKPEEKLTGLIPESFETYQLVYPGDIIIRPTDLQNDKTSLRTGLAKDKGIITSAYINLKVKKKNSTAYYHYFLHTVDITKVIYGLGTGLRQNLGYSEFKRFKFLAPPLPEQTAIAQFLDRKTALIDQAIDIKQKQIELLKERRQILIHQAVTRGLNPEVKMKDSGVEWIGEVSEHWEVMKMTHILFLLVDGTHFSPKSYDEGEFKYITAKNIKENGFDFSELSYISAKDHNVIHKRCPVKKGDILYIKDGATAGIAMINTLEEEFSLLSSVALIRAKQNLIMPEFLMHYLNSQIIKSFILTQIVGGAITRLTLELIGKFKVIVPNLRDQKAISDYIQKINSKTSSTITLKQQEIAKLQEYKATLINSAVTGKIKVGSHAQ